MIVVIIAGGSGTRLWPLSTPDYPKHLLKVHGDNRSLLQHAYARAQELTDHIYVVSEKGHIEHVRSQLPELPPDAFIVEPARRGTASCIIAALAHVNQRHGPDEAIVSIHADHYIRDVQGFVHSFKVGASVAEAAKRLVLIGIEPDYAATGFGYIQKGTIFDEEKFVYNVDSFKEKPPFETAKAYLESGDYLWNGGYFMATLHTFLELMRQYSPQMLEQYQHLDAASPQDYEEVYLGFENIAIDYALIEKSQGLLVVPATFDWMDLGSFVDMYKAVGHDEMGNHVHGKVQLEEVQNSFIQNHEDKPVAVIGLDNVVVVNTPHGIVVARKDISPKVGDVSKRFQK